ncbi:MAG: acyltransferase [Anaerolineaceae bacterium]
MTIGRGTRITACTCINTADHGFSSTDRLITDQGFVVGEVVIEEDVWIGSNVMINKGLRIGKGSVIDSGSVVTKDIPPYSVTVGGQCRVIHKWK